MSPLEYAEDLRQNGFDVEIVNKVLTEKEKNEAKEVLNVGFNYIGRKLSDLYDDMTPMAVEHVQVLQQFLMVFIEHTTNPTLVRKMIRSVKFDSNNTNASNN